MPFKSILARDLSVNSFTLVLGAIGGFLAYVLGNGKFKPVSDVIAHDMKPEDRQQLVRSVERIIADLDAADAMHLLVSGFFFKFWK